MCATIKLQCCLLVPILCRMCGTVVVCIPHNLTAWTLPCFLFTQLAIMLVLFYVVGLIISHVLIPMTVDHLTLKHYVIYSFVLLLAGVAIFYTLLLLGMDPFWSYYLAKHWCSQPDWIHLNTSLLFALVRDSSSLLG